MNRLAASSLAGVCLAAMLSSIALAQEAPQQAPPAQQQPAQAPPAEQRATENNRVRVTGMIPPPDVGAGAPYHSPQEISEIAQSAARDASDANVESRIAGKADECRDSVPDMNTPIGRDPLARVPMNTPRLQGLYRTEKNQANKVTQLAGKALTATNKAEDTRRAAAQGANNMKDVEKAEITRQKAVNELEKARLRLMEVQAQIADYGFIRMRNGGEEITWIDLDMQAVQRRKAGWGLGVPEPAKTALTVANMQSAEFEDERGFYLRITGTIVNTGAQPSPMPEFVISILDQKGFALRNVMGSPRSKGPLPPGGTQAFSYSLRPSPQYVSRVIVNFASGREPPPETPVGLLCEGAAPAD